MVGFCLAGWFLCGFNWFSLGFVAAPLQLNLGVSFVLDLAPPFLLAVLLYIQLGVFFSIGSWHPLFFFAFQRGSPRQKNPTSPNQPASGPRGPDAPDAPGRDRLELRGRWFLFFLASQRVQVWCLSGCRDSEGSTLLPCYKGCQLNFGADIKDVDSILVPL